MHSNVLPKSTLGVGGAGRMGVALLWENQMDASSAMRRTTSAGRATAWQTPEAMWVSYHWGLTLKTHGSLYIIWKQSLQIERHPQI